MFLKKVAALENSKIKNPCKLSVISEYIYVDCKNKYLSLNLHCMYKKNGICSYIILNSRMCELSNQVECFSIAWLLYALMIGSNTRCY
jgi:hypothetical protein